MYGHYGKYLLGENISKRNGERDMIKKLKISSLGENGFVSYLSLTMCLGQILCVKPNPAQGPLPQHQQRFQIVQHHPQGHRPQVTTGVYISRNYEK